MHRKRNASWKRSCPGQARIVGWSWQHVTVLSRKDGEETSAWYILSVQTGRLCELEPLAQHNLCRSYACDGTLWSTGRYSERSKCSKAAASGCT